MKTIKIAAIVAVLATAAFADESFGLQRGSVGVSVGGGALISNGTHPEVLGGVDIGLAKYVGVWVGVGDSVAYRGRENAFAAGGGLMVSGNNKSRIVPFGRFGLAYDRTTVFGYGGVSVPVAQFGGGFDGYITKHFGIETQVIGGRSFGRYGSSNSAAVAFGMFYRTR